MTVIEFIYVYLLMGFIVFWVCKTIEKECKYSTIYRKFAEKSKTFKIFVRLCWFICWPIFCIALILSLLFIVVCMIIVN